MRGTFSEFALDIVISGELDLDKQCIRVSLSSGGLLLKKQNFLLRPSDLAGSFLKQMDEIPLALFGSLTIPVLRCLETIGVTNVQGLIELPPERITELGIGFAVDPVIEFFSSSGTDAQQPADRSTAPDEATPAEAHETPAVSEKETSVAPPEPIPWKASDEPNRTEIKLYKNSTMEEVETAVATLPENTYRMTPQDFSELRTNEHTKSIKTLGDLLGKPRIYYEGFLGMRQGARISLTVKQLGYELVYARRNQKRLKIEDPRVKEATLLGEFLKILHPKDRGNAPNINGKINQADVDACSQHGIHMIEDVVSYSHAEIREKIGYGTAKRLSTSLRPYRFSLKHNKLNRPEINDGSIRLEDLKPYLPLLQTKYRLLPKDVDRIIELFGKDTTLRDLMKNSHTGWTKLVDTYFATKVSKTVTNLMRVKLTEHNPPQSQASPPS